MKSVILLVLLTLCLAPLQAQNPSIRIYVNPDIDTANAEISSVLLLWKSYLNSNPDSCYDNPYWISSEKSRYAKFDFLNTTYFSPSFYFFLPHHKATVMSIAHVDSAFVIRTLFATVADSVFCRPFCITLIVAVKEEGKFKLCNILPINTKQWHRETVGSITFPSSRRGINSTENWPVG